LDTINYSPYAHNLWGVPGHGESGSLNFSLDNNLEMKLPIANTDSTRKISLIDQLHMNMSYNFLADSLNWSDLRVSTRFKFGSYTLSLQGVFDTYIYDANGKKINVPRWKAGKGIGHLKSTGTSFSYSLTNETLRKLFGGGGDDDKKSPPTPNATGEAENENEEGLANESNMTQEPHDLRGGHKATTGTYDSDGYYIVKIPWSLSFNYSMSLGYGPWNERSKETREYPYKLTHNLGLSGNISPTQGWSLSFNTSYDFDYKKFATMQCTISRTMHCWSMSASVIPIGPYQSYNFTIAVNSSLLQDLKYTQSSNYRDAMNWGN
jgi:hypothetical protein